MRLARFSFGGITARAPGWFYDCLNHTAKWGKGSTNLKTEAPRLLGFTPSSGGGLTLNIGSGDSFCRTPPGLSQYAGGRLTMTASATNYVYLSFTTCLPASNTTGFVARVVP